jgi:hypothetical protein
MSEMATCDRCGTSFWRNPEEHWKRLCLACWKATRPPAPGNRQDMLLLENRALRAEVGSLRMELEQLRQRAVIGPAMLGRLIRLCHPDRHGNTEAANVATRWLLEQRRALEGRT